MCNYVWLRGLCVIVWFTLTLNFWYLKLKNFLSMRLIFLILCYHARHLQQIHWSKLLCGMYGFTAKSSISRLNICQILMRYTIICTANHSYVFVCLFTLFLIISLLAISIMFGVMYIPPEMLWQASTFCYNFGLVFKAFSGLPFC